MSEPTTAEMIAWCEMEEIANRAKARQGARISSSQRSIDQNNNRATMLRAIAARLRAGAPAVDHGDLKRSIDIRLNNHLCDMREGWDDSVSGFNDAWNIVRKTFAEHAAAPSALPAVSPRAGKSEPSPLEN